MDKCIIAGCEIPARGIARQKFLGLKFPVCGEHRKPLMLLMNEKLEIVQRAHKKAIRELIIEMDEMGNHEAEIALAT